MAMLSVEHHTCHQEIVSSASGQASLHSNFGQVAHTFVPLLPSSIMWYKPSGSDAPRLGK